VLSCAPGAALVTRGAYVLLDLHLHERLEEYPDTLLQEIRVVLYLSLA
jgi:hypothetical protein